MVETVVGYFAWLKSPLGGATYQKIDKDIHDGRMIISKHSLTEFDRLLIGSKIPLTATEWKLPIEELARQHPCPPIPAGQ